MRTKQTEKKGNFEMIYIGVDFGDARVGLAKSDLRAFWPARSAR